MVGFTSASTGGGWVGGGEGMGKGKGESLNVREVYKKKNKYWS